MLAPCVFSIAGLAVMASLKDSHVICYFAHKAPPQTLD